MRYFTAISLKWFQRIYEEYTTQSVEQNHQSAIVHSSIHYHNVLLIVCLLFRPNYITIYGDVTRIINPAVTARFFAYAYFLTSADHRRIFSTLNHVVKVMQQTSAGHRKRLFGDRPIRSADDKIFSRWPDDDRQAAQR